MDFTILIFILFLVICALLGDKNSSSKNTSKRNTSSKKRNTYARRSYSECPSCGSPYYNGHCAECGYPDVNQGWLGDIYD